MPIPEEQLKEARKQQEIVREKESFAVVFDQTYQRRNVAADGNPATPVQVNDTKKSMSILKKCKKLLFPSSADSTAGGLPVMEQHKEKTWKEKRSDEANAEKARLETQDNHADQYSYQIVESLKAKDKMETDSLAMYERMIPGFKENIQKYHVDRRVIRTFAGTYKTDEKGMPIDEENAHLMDKERRTVEAYVSGDLEKRKPILDDLVKEMIEKRIDPAMLNIEYVSEHITDLKKLGDKMIYLENIMKDPINKPFFDEMEPVEKEMLECSLSIADVFTGYLDQLLKIRSVDMNRYDYIRGESDNIEIINSLTEEFKRRFDTKTAQKAVNEQKIYEKYYGETFRKMIKESANPNPDLSGKADEAGLQELKEAFTVKLEYKKDGKPVMQSRIEKADSIVEESRQKEQEFNKQQADADAKVVLGIRTSSESTAIAYKKAKGTMFDSLAKDYSDLMKNLQKQDLPYDQMAAMVKKVQISEHTGARMEIGGGAEALSVQILQMFKERIVTDAGIDFLKANYEAFGAAKVFDLDGEDSRLESFVKFQMQCLINQHVSTAHSGVDAFSDFGKFATAASRTALAIVRVVDDSAPADLQKMKNDMPGVFEVAGEYMSMVKTVTAKLKERLKG